MEQYLKELLIKDLCSRLPYGLKVKRPDDGTPDYLSAIDIEGGTLMVMYNGYTDKIEKFVPYLRPMSSMTEEEESRYNLIQGLSHLDQHWTANDGKVYRYADAIDWLNAHHFDYRGLIERKLAIDVTKDGNPYEQS